MIKRILTITFLATSFFAGAQSFSGMYHFTAVTGGTVANTGTIDPTPVPTATGLTFGSFTAVGTPTNTSASGVFAFSGWGTGATTGNDAIATYTGAVDPGKYYEVTLTPQASFDITLSSVTFNINRSATGPRTFVWRSNADGYASNLSAATSNTNVSIEPTNVFFWAADSYTVSNSVQLKGCSLTLSGPNFSNQTNPMTFRLYPYNAEGTGGTFRIDTVVFNGMANIATKVGNLSFDLNSNFNVYPVPSQDGILYIENKNSMDLTKIEVLDVLGNVVVSNNPKNENRIKLNLSEMPNGNYFVRMYSGNSVSIKKIAVVK